MKKENDKTTMVKIHYPLTQCDILKSILLLGFLTKFKGFWVQNGILGTQNAGDAERICNTDNS